MINARVRWSVLLSLWLATSSGNAHGLRDEVKQYCRSEAETAANVMRFRQQGRSLAELLDVGDKAFKQLLEANGKPEKGSSEYQVLSQHHEKAQRRAIAAYARPQYRTPELQERVIAEFRDAEHARCHRETGGH